MIRLGWKRFLMVNGLFTALTLPFGVDAVSAVFFLSGIAGIIALIQAGRYYSPRSPVVWYVLAGSIGLFLVGGVAEVLTVSTDPDVVASYPGFREPFDLAAYLGIIYAIVRMARARLVNRDKMIVLDALISMGGVAALAWVGVMSAYLESDQLTAAGKATGIAFTMVSLTLGFTIVRLAIGPGARPPAYYFLAAAATGGFLSELFIELGISGRVVAGSEILITLASALGVSMLTAAALHPSMVELTEPPAEVTPRMTGKRLLAMTIAVLIPPALLLADNIRSNRYETIAIVGVWAVLSVMVMIRVFSLARTRERFSELDRALATADAALVAATDRHSMTEAVVDAVATIVPSAKSVAVHHWSEDGSWSNAGSRGRSIGPIARAPISSMSEQSDLAEHSFHFDVHFEAAEVLIGVVSIESPGLVEPYELSRLSALVADYARALEASALREELGRERSERRFRALVDNSADIIVVINDVGMVQFVSPAGPRLLGLVEDEILQSNLVDFAVEEHRQRLTEALGEPGSPSVEIQFISNKGMVRWFAVHVSDMSLEPEILGLVVTASEISAQKQAQLDLQRSEARFRSLVQHASDLVLVLESDGIISWISPSSSRVLGLASGDAIDRSVVDLCHPSDREAAMAFLGEVSSGEQRQGLELRFRHSDESWRILDVAATNLLGDPTVNGLVLNAHDVTERKTLEHHLRHQALHDDLTGIANRVKFRKRMGEAIESQQQLAVLIVDLDDFKTVNDGLGHTVGDELLTVLAERLGGTVRSSDTAARLGGDEFGVLMTDIEDRASVMTFAQRLLRTFEEPIEVSGREIGLHASIGAAFSDDLNEVTPETMLRSADLAMYGAKNRGKSRVTVFDQSMHEGVFERLELKADLTRALERDELLLHYQPVVDLTTGAISGFEALMRWNHPERGMVGPGTFIPLAEETGLIVPIGVWLVDVALRQLREWQDLYPNRKPLTMSVNVSGRQLENDDIVDDIAGAIERAGVAPSAVVVELTESVVVENSPDFIRRLDEIRAIGVGLYADDFGAGFASYSALQSLPFSGVKIDRSLVDGLDGESIDRAEAQVLSIIEMAANTDMRVVAEGIESAAQAESLRRMNCETAQGFFFARPAEASVIGEELTRRKNLAASVAP